ncbi:MAG: hypothetical protein ACI4KG_02195, partial [Oscillospiraceae bacterium]
MKKILCALMALTVCTAAFSGCNRNAENSGAELTEAEVTPTASASSEALSAETIEENVEIEIPIEEDDSDVIIDVDEFDEPDEPVGEEFSEEELISSSDENVHRYYFDDDDPPDMPEFSMSLDGLGEYDAGTVLFTRTKIKAMLECSKTGEIPYISYSDFEYEIPHLENIKVESWSVIDEKYENYRYEVTVTLDISESSVDEIPIGTADYMFIYEPGEDRSFLPLRKVGELDEDRLLPYYGEGKEYLKFCNAFTAYFSDLYAGDEVTDFSSPDLSVYDGFTSELVFNAMLTARQYYPGLDFDMTYEDLDTALREIYGFTADSINTKESGYYDAETDTVSIPGRGTYWVCGYLADESYDESSKTHTVTIDYYEDDFHLVKSQTY